MAAETELAPLFDDVVFVTRYCEPTTSEVRQWMSETQASSSRPSSALTTSQASNVIIDLKEDSKTASKYMRGSTRIFVSETQWLGKAAKISPFSEYTSERLDDTHSMAIHWIIIRQVKRRQCGQWVQTYPHQASVPLKEWFAAYFVKHGKKDVNHKWARVSFAVPAGSTRMVEI